MTRRNCVVLSVTEGTVVLSPASTLYCYVYSCTTFIVNQILHFLSIFCFVIVILYYVHYTPATRHHIMSYFILHTAVCVHSIAVVCIHYTHTHTHIHTTSTFHLLTSLIINKCQSLILHKSININKWWINMKCSI